MATGTNDFDNVTAEEMSELVSFYKFLGEHLKAGMSMEC